MNPLTTVLNSLILYFSKPPVKTVTIRSKDAVWINADICWAIKQRYRLFKKAKRSNKDEDWRAYRTYRNLVIAKIRDRKLEYLNKLDLNGI